MSSKKFVFFRPIGKTRWLPRPLIGWDIFDFSSETAEQNSTELDRMQDRNVLYQVCIFRADRQKQNGRLGLIGWDIFDFSSERNSTKLERKQDLNVFYQVCVFSGRSEKQDDRSGLGLTGTFSTSPLKPLNWTQRNLTKRKISTSSIKLVFFRPISKQIWRPWPIRQKGGTLFSGARYVALMASCFYWPEKKTNLVKVVKFLLPDKFDRTPFSGSRGIFENVTANKTLGSNLVFFSIGKKNHKLDGAHFLASCQVSTNSVWTTVSKKMYQQRIKEDVSKMYQQIRGRSAIFFIPIPKNTNFIEDVEFLLPVMFR